MGNLEKLLSEVPPSSRGFVTINYVENVHASGQSSTHIGNNNYLSSLDEGHDAGHPEPIDEKNAPYWIVPFGRNKEFIGRESVLSAVLTTIPPSTDKDACQHTAIEGLGGIGKTQIALEAVFRLRESHKDCSVFWVSALDATSFENAYRDIGQRLKVQGIGNPNADVKLLVKKALSETSIQWLLVIDNTDDVGLLFGSETSLLDNYLPSNHNGSVLFTTRSHDVAMALDISKTNVVSVAGMERSEAYEMLQAKSRPEQIQDSKSTESLLDFLADVPLAIKQAASYMERVGITTTEYLEDCRSSDSRLIKLLTNNFSDRTRYQNARNPVATTWLISFQHISDTSPLAAKYLQYMSLLSEKDIPMTLLPPARAGQDLREALQTLVLYSFIAKRPDQQSYDMHRLVRLVVRNWLHQHDGAEATYAKMIRHLCKTFTCPTCENSESWRGLLPHLANAVNSDIECWDERSLRLLTSDVAQGCYILGNYQQSEILLRKCLQLSISLFGEDGLDTTHTQSSLGGILECQGKYNQATTIYEQVVACQERVTGKTSPDTLKSMTNLSFCLWKSGKLKEATQMQQQSLDLHNEVLGNRHPSTLQAMQVMAVLLDDNGKIREGADMRKSLLRLHEEVFEKDHIETLRIKQDVANSLQRLGQLEEAEKLFRDALIGHERLFGKKHPDTLKCMSSTADVLWNRGMVEEARGMSWTTLGLQQEALGKHHPETLMSAVRYANIVTDLGEFPEAEEIYRQTLSLQEKTLGNEHPQTLDTSHSLARVLSRQGKHQEAEVLFGQTLDSRIKTLGKEHPDTLATTHSLADVLAQQGRNQEAEPIFRQTLDSKIKSLGREHPNTLATMYTLADVIAQQGRLREAEAILRQTLDSWTNALGRHHPHTISNMHGLADIIARQGRFEEAEAAFRQALDSRIKTLGREHPSTLSTMHSLADVAARQGKLQDAKAISQKTLDLGVKALGRSHPRTQATMRLLERVQEELGKSEEAKMEGNRLEPAPTAPKQRRGLGLFRSMLKLGGS